MKQEQTDAMEKQARFENSFQEYASHMLTASGKEVSWVMYAHAFNAGWNAHAAALEAGKAVDEKPEQDAMSTENHINESRSARKLTLADYGLVIHND
jgi:hypothetical protein